MADANLDRFNPTTRKTGEYYAKALHAASHRATAEGGGEAGRDVTSLSARTVPLFKPVRVLGKPTPFSWRRLVGG